MEILAWAVVLILIVLLFQRSSKQGTELEIVKHDLAVLRKTIAEKSDPPQSEEAEPLNSDSEQTSEIPHLIWSGPEQETAIEIYEEKESPTPQIPEPGVRASPQEKTPQGYFQSEAWKRTEKFLLENLTGILGTLGVVLGLGFLGVYSALMLEPVFRVLLLIVVSSAIAIVAGYFLRISKWGSLAQWAQSAAFAVFLLACLGSGGIPGLKWIDDPLLAWGFLTVGVAANLGLAFVRKSQVFASVHAVLGLAALAVAGSSPIIVSTMSIVAVGSLLLVRDRKWEAHLSITESAFVGILLLFYFTSPEPSEVLRFNATFGLVVVFAIGQATHYRKVHSNTTWETSAVLTHLLFWALTSIGLFLYAPRNDLVLTPCLLGVSVIVGLVARMARRRGIRWLYRIDTLISLASAFAAVLSLIAWQVALTPLILALLVLSLAFTMLMILEGEKFLAQIGSRVTEIITLFVTVLGIGGSDAIALSLAGLFIGVFQAFFVHLFKEAETPPSLFDFLLPWIFVIAALVVPNGQIIQGVPSGYGLLLSLLGLFLWQRGRAARWLRLGLLTATMGVSVLQWIILAFGLIFGKHDWLLSLVVSLPMVLLPLLGLFLTRKSDTRGRAILLWVFGVNLGLSALIILWSILPAIIPVAWMIFGMALIWIPKLQTSPLTATAAALGYAFLAGSLLIFGPLVLTNRDVWGSLPIRWGIEFVVFGSLFATYLTRSLRPESGHVLLDSLSPILLETSLLVLIVSVGFEVPIRSLSLVTASISIVMLACSFLKKTQKRVIFHSVLVFWLSALFLIWASTAKAGGIELWLASGVQLLWLSTVFSIKPGHTTDFPKALSWLDPLAQLLFKRLPLFIVIPLGTVWALSLSFVFDATLLTLLWSLESFGVFVLALILRERFFRLISLASLGVCLIRLVFFDLAQADTLSRALVFLGVGILLILMNILYTRFKSRVTPEKGVE